MTLAEKRDRLLERLKSYKCIAVAFSAGVDSTVVAKAAQLLGRFPETAAIWLPGGEPPVAGSVLKIPDLAATLQRFATDGFNGFYKGKTAELLVDGVQRAGGIWTLDDLAGYQVT